MAVDERGSVLLIEATPPRRSRSAWLRDHGFGVLVPEPGALGPQVEALRPDVVLCVDSVAVLEPGSVPVVVLADSPSTRQVLEGVRGGAFDVIDRQSDDDVLLVSLERALRHARVVRDNERLASDLCCTREGLRVRDDELQERTRRHALVEEALALARDHALSASQAKSAFLTNMSHELRTPLNAMLGYAELMAETIDDAVIIGDLGRIVFAGRHLLGLIDDVLDLAKVEAGHARVELEEVEIDAVIEAVRLEALPAVRQGGLAFVVDRQGPPVATFEGDRRHVVQCLNQLVDNAVRFTKEGCVTLGVELCDDELLLSVRDTGCGISLRDQASIFGAFHPMDPKVRGAGAGIGLTIARRLCDLMGARLTLSSEVGVGSTFTLALPVRPEPAGDDPSDWSVMESAC